MQDGSAWLGRWGQQPSNELGRSAAGDQAWEAGASQRVREVWAAASQRAREVGAAAGRRRGRDEEFDGGRRRATRQKLERTVFSS
jgi:hypothetical protein